MKKNQRTISQELRTIAKELGTISLALEERTRTPYYKGPRITRHDLATIKRRTIRIRNILGIPKEG